MGEMIKKYFTGETKEINEEERTDIGLVSVITIDRDGDVLLPEGCDLTNFTKNPVVQWAHQYGELPIGKSLWIKATDKGLLSKTKYANTEFANDVWELKKGGFLNAYSVGFLPKEIITDTKEIERVKAEKGLQGDIGQIISKWDLLEYSVCPVPCNPDALTLMSKKVKSKEMKKMLNEINKPIEKEEIHEDEAPEVQPEIKADPEPEVKTGAVLNKKNKSALKQAMELIQGVMDSAAEEEPEPEKTAEELKLKAEEEAKQKAETEQKAKEEAEKKAKEEAEAKAKAEEEQKTADIIRQIEEKMDGLNKKMYQMTGKLD